MNIVPSLDPGSPRVRFGAEMRRLREAAQLSQSAVAARLGCTQTQVSRLEKATRSPSRSDAERLERLFGESDGVSFIRMYQQIHAQPGGPVWFRDWAEEIEPTARVIRSWDPMLVPGLLQTESYARAIFTLEPRATFETVEQRVEARMRRQRILVRDNPPRVIVLFEAGVLQRSVGGPEVMREQLGRLLEAASSPSISIQLVDPECLPGLAGAFMIAELPDGRPITVNADSPAQGHVTTDYEHVAAIQERYETIRLWAYPERTSLQMVEKARHEWT
ncbi:helix-turn-helix transcriptional regulator [Spongiactinospora sp. TRM90649]|uniref:helix-turn-helix domain-containing protein n=1 Tax=Spongiactinospora sp. TRM90649 TaxID=3031114 RepID=UPI0023F7BD44|nr:helix-turn-helix transcriptional regulator [Spongiactinospora sp. TRM90649]MDF5755558.1 helix-turn-helix transcriptional regulator [Spongiactinospora sp. TRM90649]